MSYETSHERYLNFVRATMGVHRKRVLEVGGSTPPVIVNGYSPSEWISVNLNASDVATFNEEARTLKGETSPVNGNAYDPPGSYLAVCDDIRNLAQTEHYDLIYSVNAFEHIHDLEVVFRRMFGALKPGGYLFTLFGPIWSSDVGHHLSVRTDDKRELHFFDGVLAPWEHLTSSREAIRERLARLYGEKTAQRAVDYIYDFRDLNRLSEQDYLRIVQGSDFSPVLILRHKVGRAPNLPGATNTREFLMILKKGCATHLERAVCFSRFAFAFAGYELRKRLPRRSKGGLLDYPEHGIPSPTPKWRNSAQQ